MSNDQRRIPGERLLNRVLKRGTVRPSIGTPAAFYERFGLADPMADHGFVPVEAMHDEHGFFSFLSAEPYYRALRAQASWRSSQARRRLLGRIAAQSDSFGAGAMRTRIAGIGAPAVGVRRMALGGSMTTDSMLTTLERPQSREDLIEELEAEGWTPGETARRSSPTRRLRRRSRRLAPVAQSLLESVEAASPVSGRRAAQRIRQQIVDLDEAEQVMVVERLARSVRGPLRRMATVDASSAQSLISERPVDVAAERGNPRAARRKGLRPVMHASPALKTLLFDDATADTSPVQSRLRRRNAPEPASARNVRRTRTATTEGAGRDARQQTAAGRAGPAAVYAANNVASVSLSAAGRPTERLARRARNADTAASQPTRRAQPMRAVDAAATSVAPTARMVRRATVPSADGPVFASPTAQLAESAAVPRRSRRASVGPVGLTATLMGRAEDAPSAPVVAGLSRSVSAQMQSRTPMRRITQTATGFQYITPAGSEELVADTKMPRTAPRRGKAIVRPEQGLAHRESAVSRPTARAARRAGRSFGAPASIPVGPVVGEATAPIVRRATAFASGRRTAATVEVSTDRPARRRVHVASLPTQFVHPVDASEQAVATPMTRHRRPSERLHDRAVDIARVDERDVAQQVASPARYVKASTRLEDGSIAASPVVRRSRVTAPEGTVLAHADESVSVPATEHMARRARRADPVVSSRVQDRSARATVLSDAGQAASRRVADRAVPSVSQAQRPLRTRVAGERAEVGADSSGASRVARQTAPTGTFLSHDDVATPGDVGPTARRRRPVRVRDVSGNVVRKAAVGTGSVVYAAARVEQALDIDPSAATSTSSAARRRRPSASPLAAERRRTFRPVGYASASRDFSLLVPQVPVAEESAPSRRSGSGSRVASSRRGAAPSVRIEATGPMSRADLDSVLKQVSGVIRAMERSEAPRVATPAARRSVQSQAPVESSFAPRLSRSPVSARRWQHSASAPGQTTLRSGASSAPTEEHSARSPHLRATDGTLPQVNAGRSGAPSSSQWTESARSGGRSRSSAVRSSRRSGVSRQSMAYAEQRGAEGPSGVRSSQRWSPQAGPSGRPSAPNAPGSASRRVARPRLADTLGGLSRSTSPLGVVAQSASQHTLDDDTRGWARRAETGSGVRRASVASADGVVSQTDPMARTAEGTPISGTPRSGTVLHALARANSAEDVVRVIMERADGLRGVAKELPGPAVDLVERIVRATDQANVQSANVVQPDDLAPLTTHSRAPAAVDSDSASHGGWNGQRSRPARRSQQGGNGQTMRLANKLMRLVHLAENERRLAEAQRHVRMAQEGENVGGGGGGSESASGEAAKAPNMKALQRDVFESVLREMELSKMRRQEDFDVSIWW